MNISYTPDTHRYTQIGTHGYIWSWVSGPHCQIYRIKIIIIIITMIIMIIKIIIKVSTYKNYEIIKCLHKILLYTIYNILVLVLFSVRYIQS